MTKVAKVICSRGQSEAGGSCWQRRRGAGGFRATFRCFRFTDPYLVNIINKYHLHTCEYDAMKRSNLTISAKEGRNTLLRRANMINVVSAEHQSARHPFGQK